MRFASSPVTKMRGSEGAGALLEFPYEGEKFAAGGEQMGGVGWRRRPGVDVEDAADVLAACARAGAAATPTR